MNWVLQIEFRLSEKQSIIVNTSLDLVYNK